MNFKAILQLVRDQSTIGVACVGDDVSSEKSKGIGETIRAAPRPAEEST